MSQSAHDPRPEFMITLGLAPPYAKEDVKKAYFEKAKLVHPDHGGSVAAFNELQQAFDRAQEYIEFRGDRRAWIGAKMERYIALEEAVERLGKLGVLVETTSHDWLEHSYGDFAQLTETAFSATAAGAANGDAIIAALVAEKDSLHDLQEIDLAGCQISDDAVLALGVFPGLRSLNLAQTPITADALDVVEDLPQLETLGLDGTQVGWWANRRVQARLRRRAKE